MVRPTRTNAQLKEEIVKNAAIYTIARTDWEGERRDVKKKALRTIGRLTRQLCERTGHRYGQLASDAPIIGNMGAGFKCPVCDPSGDIKREAHTGMTAEELRKEKIEEAFRRSPTRKLPTGECCKCHGTCDPKYITDGVCVICLETPAESEG